MTAAPSGLRQSFQSSLPVTGERVTALQKLTSTVPRFQSSLPVTGERVLAARPRRRARQGFNPRSP